MQQVTLDIADDYIHKFMLMLQALPKNKVKGNFTYVDDLGDTIEVIDGEEYVVPTEDDLKMIRESRAEYERGEYFTIEEIEQERKKSFEDV